MLVITAHPGYTAGQKLPRVAKEVVTRAIDGTAKERSGDGEIYRILSVWVGGAGGMSSIHCASVL